MYEFGPYRLDAVQRVLLRNGAPVPLGPKAVETLVALVENAGRTISKDRLIERVWPEGFVDDASLSQNIYLLRKQLRADLDSDPIETLPRRGYRFNAPVTVHDASPSDLLKAPVRPNRAGRFAAALALCVLAAIATLYVARTAGPAGPGAPRLDAGSQKLYDSGRFYWEQRSLAGETRALELFKQVVARQPASAWGYLGLADTYAVSADYCFIKTECGADARLAKGMLARALALAPDLPQAHASSAMIAAELDRDNVMAAKEFGRAIQLDPDYALAHHWFGTMLFARRDFAQARSQFETAAGQDPTSAAIAAWLARDYYFLHRNADAVSFAHQSLQLNPARIDALAILGLATAAEGRYGQSIAPLNRLAQAGFPAKARALRAYVYAVHGDSNAALRELRDLRPTPENLRVNGGGMVLENYRYPDETDMAAIYFALDRPSEAMQWLGRITSDVPSVKAWIAVDPRFDRTRSVPAFRAWLR